MSTCFWNNILRYAHSHIVISNRCQYAQKIKKDLKQTCAPRTLKCENFEFPSDCIFHWKTPWILVSCKVLLNIFRVQWHTFLSFVRLLDQILDELVWFRIMVFNSHFNNISVILWWSVVLVEEIYAISPYHH